MDTSIAVGRHVLLLNWRDTRNPEGGGSEVYVERLASELSARGHGATILCAAHAHGPAEEHTTDGVTILRRGSRHTIYLRAALAYLGCKLGMGKLKRPDVIVDVGNGMPFLSALYARVPVIALVHHVHKEQWPVVMGSRWLARLGWWIESRLAPWAYRKCRYVTVSEATRQELSQLGVDADRVTVIHNGTPEQPAIEVTRDSQPSLIVVGRLVPHKRVEVALQAVAQLRGEFPGLRLTVAGTGYWEPQLRQAAVDLGIADRVDFAGFVDHEEKYRLMGQAWLSLMPSLKEGWGLTIVEAGSVGTPTVAFAQAGGVAEALVDGETGLLAADETHYVQLVGQLLANRDRCEAMGLAAREHAASFTWKTSGDRFAEMVEEQ